MVNINISTKDEDSVMSLVDELISLSEPNEFELVYKNQNRFESNDRLYILGEIINITKLEINNSHKRGFIKTAIKKYKNYKKKNYSYFKRGLKTIVTNYYKKKAIKYKILFPMNIDYNWIKILEVIKFNNIQMELHDYDYISDNFLQNNKDEIEKYGDVLTSMKEGYSYFIVILYGRDVHSSFEQANSMIELYRGFINLIDNGGRITWQYGTSQGNPFSKYGPSKNMLVFDSKNNFIAYYFRTVHNKHEIISSPFEKNGRDEIDKIRELLNRYENSSNFKLKNLIEQLIHSYNLALDETEPNFRFLFFWQILENIFRESEDDKFDKITKRIKNMSKNDRNVSKIIDILFIKRNKLVHDGDNKYIENEDVHQIKHIVDSILLNFVYNFEQYKTKYDLIYYFDNVDLKLDVIDEKIKSLQRIKQLR